MIQLAQIAAELEGAIEDQDAQMFVTVETGFDEGNIVGTRDAYLRLAKVLLEFVVAVDNGEATPDGTGCPGSSAIGRVFDATCEVDIDSMRMSETEQQARAQMERLRDV